MNDRCSALVPEPVADLPKEGSPVPEKVLHLTGRITEAVFGFLGPATATLAEQGVRQTIVLVDTPNMRHLLTRFDPSVQLVLIYAELPFRKRQAALLRAYCQSARAARPTAVHLHGSMCLLLGLYAMYVRRLAAPIFFTPHGSRTLALLRPLRTYLGGLNRLPSNGRTPHVIASSIAEARMMQGEATDSVDVVESPVGPAFFEDMPEPGPAPRVIAGHHVENPLGSEQFARCAVLLADQIQDLRFIWIGGADSEAAGRMNAAGIMRSTHEDAAMRARVIAGAWVFLALDGGVGFPGLLAEAMVLGVPCVAWDTPNHRDLIEHAVTGYLCADADEALEYLAELLESLPLRKRIGEAARVEARRRFDGRRFQAALLGSYGRTVAP